MITAIVEHDDGSTTEGSGPSRKSALERALGLVQSISQNKIQGVSRQEPEKTPPEKNPIAKFGHCKGEKASDMDVTDLDWYTKKKLASISTTRSLRRADIATLRDWNEWRVFRGIVPLKIPAE